MIEYLRGELTKLVCMCAFQNSENLLIRNDLALTCPLVDRAVYVHMYSMCSDTSSITLATNCILSVCSLSKCSHLIYLTLFSSKPTSQQPSPTFPPYLLLQSHPVLQENILLIRCVVCDAGRRKRTKPCCRQRCRV